ncbi:BglG family transcription antiterminator [Caniella muris]|uniref:BglG family transcription antiterminator n=1 Tax=Caniella muris TaxID=2941502 RepID=UPI00203C94EA|nr:HTH domain-containing protein [Caniella muris]
MNARQGELLRRLLDAEGHLTAVELADDLGCSERTIRSDVGVLRDAMAREGLRTTVDARRGAGIGLTVVPGEHDSLLRLLGESDTSMHPRFERLCQEILLMVATPGPHSSRSLASALYRTPTQVQRDLHWWRGVLGKRHLASVKGRSVDVEGDEWALRGFVMSLLFALAPPAVRSHILPMLTDGLSAEDLAAIEECEEDLQDALGFEFSGNAAWQLSVYLVLMLVRIRLGHVIESWPHGQAPHGVLRKLGAKLERRCAVAVSDAELALLWDMARCCTWQWSLAALDAAEPSERARTIVGAMDRALTAAFGEPLSPALIKPLAVLVESSLVRRACGLSALNPNECSVKYDAMDAAAAVSSVLCSVPELVDADLYGSDYGRLLLALLDYIESTGSLRSLRVGLVVNSGIDLAIWGAARIERLSPRLKVADVLNGQRVEAAGGPAAADLERFDFLVSFEPLSVDYPSITVSPAVSRADVDAIIDSIPFWRRGRTPTPWARKTLPALADAHGLVGALYEDLCAEGLLAMGEERFRWLLRELSCVKGRTLVWCWCGPDVKAAGIRIYTVSGAPQGAVQWPSVAVLVLPISERGQLTVQTRWFKQLVAEFADLGTPADDEFLSTLTRQEGAVWA